MKCVKCVYKDDRGTLIADVKRDASGLTYVAIEGDIIVVAYGRRRAERVRR